MMRARLFAWANIMTNFCQDPTYRKVMIGFTYAPGQEYSPGHIHEYVKKMKRTLGENLIAFAWVAEMQSRGAVHYHMMMVVKKGTNVPMPDKSGMWGFGSSKISTARSFFYICTYVGKEYQKDFDKFPKSCRLYGASMRGNKDLQKTFRALSRLDRSNNTGDAKYRFLGATVTEGYTQILLDTAKAGLV